MFFKENKKLFIVLGALIIGLLYSFLFVFLKFEKGWLQC